jgi:hypothetical protein
MVAPLEGLWWTEDMTRSSTERQVELVVDDDDHAAPEATAQLAEETASEVGRKKQLAAAAELALQRLRRGPVRPAAPCGAPTPTRRPRSRACTPSSRGRAMGGVASTTRSTSATAPERLKAIIRQPVEHSNGRSDERHVHDPD